MGLEHLLLGGQTANGMIIALDEEHGPFRFNYHITWGNSWQFHKADLSVVTDCHTRTLILHTDGQGSWRNGRGNTIEELNGCTDIDIWPTPFTNSFPILREPIGIGERRQFLTAWVSGLDLTVHKQQQAYTRLADRQYLFESLEDNGFTAELLVDEDGIVIDYPNLFRRVK